MKTLADVMPVKTVDVYNNQKFLLKKIPLIKSLITSKFSQK